MVTAAINTLITLAIGALFGAVIASAKEFFEKKNAQTKAIKAMLHDSFFRSCRYALDQNEISEAEAENIQHLYDAYHTMGMNGYGDIRFEQVKGKFSSKFEK